MDPRVAWAMLHVTNEMLGTYMDSVGQGFMEEERGGGAGRRVATFAHYGRSLDVTNELSKSLLGCPGRLLEPRESCAATQLVNGDAPPNVASGLRTAAP